MRSWILSYRKNSDGAILPLFALLLVPLLVLITGVIDVEKTWTVKTKLQSAADQASTAGASTASLDGNNRAIATAKRIFKTQAELLGLTDATATVSIAGREVTVQSTATVPRGSIFSPGRNRTVSVTSAAKWLVPDRYLDIAMCIDRTSSMRPTLRSAQRAALNFYEDVNEAVVRMNLTPFKQIRVKVYYYTDFDFSDPNPLVTSKFYTLPNDKHQFEDFVGSFDISADLSNYDWPESGNECVEAAIRSPWFKLTDPEALFYPFIVIWSDADAKNSPRTRNLPQLWASPTLIPQDNRTIIHFGVCTEPVASTPGWARVRSFTGYYCGGTLQEANDDFVELLALAIVGRMKASKVMVTK